MEREKLSFGRFSPLFMGTFADRLGGSILYIRFRLFAESLYAPLLLFFVGVLEGALFPMPADELLIFFGILDPKNVFRFMMASVFGCVCGGYIGLAFGFMGWDFLYSHMILLYDWGEVSARALKGFDTYGFSWFFYSGFTPVPFCLMNYLAGTNLGEITGLNLQSYAVALWFSRLIKYVPLSVLLYFYGARLHPWIEQRFIAYLLISLAVMGMMFFLTHWSMH